MAESVKNPPAMQETWVQSLGWEDPLEKEMATHSSVLAWRIPGTGSNLAAAAKTLRRSVWLEPRNEEESDQRDDFMRRGGTTS